MDDVSDIIQQVLKLPRDERAVIAREIAASLNDDQTATSEQVTEAWTSELRARRDDIVSGRVKALRMDDVLAAARARLRAR